MPFCSNCGTKLKEDAKFCYECGAKTDNNETPKSSERYDVIEEKPVQNGPDIFASVTEKVGLGIKSISKNAKQIVDSSTVKGIKNQIFQGIDIDNSKISFGADNSQTRMQEYAGKIVKCPNCGATISQSSVICSDCGFQITGQAVVSSVKLFAEQLMDIEKKRKDHRISNMLGIGSFDSVDKQKLTLIKSFPIPNTIDDILEFVMLAIANIDVKLSKKTIGNKISSSAQGTDKSVKAARTISDAWVSKLQQAYQKAEITFSEQPMFAKIQKVYYDKMKELKIK